MELVSVIVPTYNVASKIRRCLACLCKQTYPCLEIIVIDDGSTDGTAEEVRKVAKQDERIRFITQENKGVAAARNKGLEAAQGVYIAFCDGDDFVSHDYIDKLTEGRKRQDADWVISGFCKVIGKNRYMFGEPYEGAVVSQKARELFLKEWYKNQHIPTVWGNLYRGEILRRYGITFPENLEHGEDTIFNIRYVSRCKRIDFVKEPLYFYEESGQSLTSKSHKDIWEKQLAIFKEYRDMIGMCGYSEVCTAFFFARGILLALNHANEKQWNATEWERLCNIMRIHPYFSVCAMQREEMDGFARIVTALLDKRKYGWIKTLYRIKRFGHDYLQKVYYRFRR